MKKMHFSEATGLSLIQQDDKNYIVAKVTQKKDSTDEVITSPSYFSSVISALKFLAKAEADVNFTEGKLSTWIYEIRKSFSEFEKKFEEAIKASH